MRNVVLIFCLSLFLVGIVGVLPSIIYSDWNWFSRSGALLVIAGVYFTWADFVSEIRNLFDKERQKINENTEKKFDLLVNNSFGEIMNPEYASDLIKQENTKKHSYIELNEKSKTIIYRRIEIFTVIIGTLIWAYGDLINNFVCR